MNTPQPLHAARTYPDGDPAALIREQLQRIVRRAQDNGFIVHIEQRRDGPEVRVVRRPENA